MRGEFGREWIHVYVWLRPQSVNPKGISPEYSLEGLMLRKLEGKRRRECQRMRWFDSTTVLIDMSLSKLREIVEDRGAWHAAVHGAQRVSQT